MAMTDEEFTVDQKRLAYLLVKRDLRTKAEEGEYEDLLSRITAEKNRRRFVIPHGTPIKYGSPMPAIVREAKAQAEKARTQQGETNNDSEESQ